MASIGFGGDDEFEFDEPVDNRPPSPSPSSGLPDAGDPYASVRGQVANWYKEFLGREGSRPEYDSHLSIGQKGRNANQYRFQDQGYLDQVLNTIKNSSEATGYRNRQTANPTTPPAGGAGSGGGTGGGTSSDPYGWVDEALKAAESTDDPAYWRRVIMADPNANGSAKQYWLMRIAKGDGARAVREGRETTYGGGGGGDTVNRERGGGLQAPGPNPGGYDDPSSMLFLNEVMQRLIELKQPKKDPYQDLAQLVALMRAGELGADRPYTAGEDAALVTQYRDPLTQARDQAKRQAAEEMSRRGIGPTSGLFHKRMGEIDAAYSKGLAQGSNQLAVRAVDERQRRKDKQLDILMNLLDVSRSSSDRDDARSREVLQTAEIFPNFDERRLNMLLGASGSGGNPSSSISSLLQLGQLNNQTRTLNDSSTQSNREMWGDIIGFITGLLD